MTVKSILDAKGRDVATVGLGETLERAIDKLAAQRIGALVAVRPDGAVAGILSERDVVRVLGESGAGALKRTVSETMTVPVRTCGEESTVQQVMEIMTRGRFRHLPVVRDGALVGIVSIGDVVKRRIEDAEREAEDIKTYIATA